MSVKKGRFTTFSLLLLIMVLFSSSCSHGPISTKDFTAQEWPARTPANWLNSCADSIAAFFKPKTVIQQVSGLPELTQLNPQIKKFANGKNYTQYTANINVMNKYPDYDDFIKKTVEIIFEPVEPFGHINLRIGNTIYSFNYVQSTSINKFSPRIKKSSSENMPSSTGFVFEVDPEQILKLKKDIDAVYTSSVSHNLPPFDAYSPLLKIVEEEGFLGKNLKFQSPSPNHGNDQGVKGQIVQEGSNFFLDTGAGMKVPLVKQGHDFYVQSYSCSSSAEYVLANFFGINLSYADSAKALHHSLSKGNINESISPVAVIKYYED